MAAFTRDIPTKYRKRANKGISQKIQSFVHNYFQKVVNILKTLSNIIRLSIRNILIPDFVF